MAVKLSRFGLKLFVVGVVLTVLLAGTRGAMPAEVLWRYSPGAGYVDASPALGDVDDDGILDVILTTTAGEVVVLDADGREKWKTSVGATVSVPATFLESSSGEPRVVGLTNTGMVFCLEGRSGARLWSYQLPGRITWGVTAVSAADLDGDGAPELIAGDQLGNVVCLSETGRVLWTIRLKSAVRTAPAVGDVNGDGRQEILLGTAKSPVVWIDTDGRLRRTIAGKAVGSSPVLCDLDGDGKGEILVGEGRGLSCYDASGRRLWAQRMRKQMHDGIAVGDVDQDGKPEVVAVDLFGQLVCLDRSGKPLWFGNVEERVRRSPAIADVDGDGQMEVLIAGYSAVLYVYDPEGNLEERMPLRGPSNGAPTVVDFRGDGKLAVVCVTTAEVLCLSWMEQRPPSEPGVEWAEYRANSARTGSALRTARGLRPRIRSVDFGRLHVGTNRFTAVVSNPGAQTLTLELEARRPGTRAVAYAVTSSDSVFRGDLVYNVSGAAAENLTLRATLRRGKKVLARRERTFYLVPFAKEEADVGKLLAEVRSRVKSLEHRTWPEERLRILGLELEELSRRARGASALGSLERSLLRDRFERLFREALELRALVTEAGRVRSRLAVYAANPWAPFGGRAELVEDRTLEPKLEVDCFSGEIESAALNVANFSDNPVWVRVEPEPILNQKDSTTVSPRQVLSFFEVLPVPTQSLDMSADALPKLNQANALLVPAWDVRQLWVRIDSKALKPSLWRARLRLRSVEVEPAQAFAELTVKVWQASLPEEQPVRLCHWGYVHRSVLRDQPEAALRDQVQHGTNVFVATADFAPPCEFDNRGELVSMPDFRAHDEYVRKHAPHGVILFFNYQVQLKGPAERFSPVWEMAYKKWISLWVQHLEELGLGYEDFAFYPIDEPGLREGLVDQFIRYAKPIKEVDPKVQIYADPVSGASMEDLERMAPYVDIWCPNRDSFLLNRGRRRLEFIKSTGKTVWTYACEGNAKHQSPIGYYRAQAWLIWYRGLSGMGFWSYCTSRHDPWYVPEGGSDYLLIYQGEGVVTSKRWEAVRDGVEDYAMLWKLQQAVEAASETPGMSKLVKEAREFLTRGVFDVAQFCGLDAYGTLPTSKGEAFLRQLEDRRWETVRARRKQLAQLLQAFGVR